MWRGGRHFTSNFNSRNKIGSTDPPNGTSGEDSVMVLSSDDDEPSRALSQKSTFVDNPTFEDSIPQTPEFPEIVQMLDLAFGGPVYHIAVLPMTPCTAEDAPFAGADLLKDKAVFAVSSHASDISLVILPLTPPSNESKARPELRASLVAPLVGAGVWGETIFKLGGSTKTSEGLAISLLRPKPASRLLSSVDNSSPRVIVASYSHETSGTLSLWDVSLTQKPADLPLQPFQIEYLPSYPTGISFNPTHSTQLLLTMSPHAVRIYDFATPSPTLNDMSQGPFPSQGSWLLSLFPPFLRQSLGRKPIIAAEWICRGRAVLALLADGQWGIWDIDGANPSASTLLGKQNPGIKGAAISSFSVAGYVEGTSGLRNPTAQKGPAMTGDFIPMTPSTRKESMFASFGVERLHGIHGGIAVASLPGRGTATGDESVVMWLGGSEHVVVIPGISAFWASQEKRGKSDGGGVNLFSGTTPTRMVRLDTLAAGLMGERCNGVEAIVRLENNGVPSKDAEQGLPIEVVIRGENRLVIAHMGECGAGNKIGGVVGWKRKLANGSKSFEPTSALIVYPRPEKPSSVAFNLSVIPSGAFRSRAVSAQIDEEQASPSEKQAQSSSLRLPLPTRPKTSGLTFVDQINRAADAEEDAEERNVEEEMLDIMEIDRALESMEDERLQGRKKVFFEEGFDNAF